jgi:hypothetical protein
MYILDVKQIPSLLNMVGATEERVHLFKADTARLWNQEEDENA